jgi:NADH dehydrogenase FAD-containing subunit
MRNANAAVQVSANSRARSLPPSVDAAGREAWLTFVVVVDGPTGVELAGALSELAHTGLESDYRAINPATARVILVQSAPWILPAFSSALSARAERSLRDLGVDVRTGAKVTDIDEDAMAIDGIHIPARTTFWAAGVAASSAAKWLGRAADKLEPVGRRQCPRAGACGKATGSVRRQCDSRGHRGTSGAGGLSGCHYGNLATIGRLTSVVELRWLRLWGAPAWWLWAPAHVFLPTGGRNRATVVLNWLWTWHPPYHGKYHGRLSSRFGDRELLQLTSLILGLVILVRMF